MLITPLITLVTGTPATPHIVAPGQSLDLEPSEANRLIRRGFAVKNNNPINLNSMVDAISKLSKKDFSKEGKPHLKALENIIGQPINTKLRNWSFDKNLQVVIFLAMICGCIYFINIV